MTIGVDTPTPTGRDDGAGSGRFILLDFRTQLLSALEYRNPSIPSFGYAPTGSVVIV